MSDISMPKGFFGGYFPGCKDGKPIPACTRATVLKRADGMCEDCGRSVALELHHLHYYTVGEEVPDDLHALCRECHLNRHLDLNGDFWPDPVEMEQHWEGYHNEMDKDD